MKDQKNIEKTEERGLIIKNDISTSLLTGEETSKIKRVTSLNPDDPEQMEILVSSMDKTDNLLNEEVGKILEVVGHTIGTYERKEEVIDEDSGEVKEIIRTKHNLVLYTSDGQSHATGSESCFQSYALVVGMLKRTPTKEEPMKFEVINRPAEEKGHNYLALKYVREVK